MFMEKRKFKQYLLLIAFGVALFWGLTNYRLVFSAAGNILSVLSPVIIGLCIAFILNVPMSSFERRVFRPSKKTGKMGKVKSKLKRPVSIIFVILLFLLIIFMIFYLVIPALIETLTQLSAEIPAYVDKLSKTLKDQPIILSWFDRIDMGKEAAIEKLTSILKNSVLTLQTIDSTINMVSSIFSSIVDFVLGICFAIYMLAQKEKLMSQCKKLVYALVKENIADKLVYICKKSSDTFSKFLTGQCTEAIILGSLCMIGMLIMRMPYALLVGVLVAVTAFIPIVGAFIGVAVGAFLISVTNLSQALWFVIFMIILQQVEGNFIYPHVVGSSVGLPSIWVLFAVTVGGNIGGIIGMFVSVPVCAVLYCLLSDLVAWINKKKHPELINVTVGDASMEEAEDAEVEKEEEK